MEIGSLGRLAAVDVRAVWTSESGDFTPWLARDDNLSLLADTLGLDLELEAREKDVGPFRADLVCRDTADGSLVLIENQLERTDHTHLGQLLTYAAGLDVCSIVWIAERFTDEHRAALDWLNEITSDKISFFGLEIQLWRIGDSPIAPKFNIVSKPNDWTKGGGSGLCGSFTSSETELLQQEYWRSLREMMLARKSMLKPQAAQPKHWMTVAIGRSGFHLATLVNTNDDRIGVELYIKGPTAKEWFRQLAMQKTEIEYQIGHSLEWRELPGKKASRIQVFRSNSDIESRGDWPQQHAWLAETLEKMSAAFKPRVLALPATDIESSDSRESRENVV